MINDIAEKIYSGRRIDVADAKRLYEHSNLAELGICLLYTSDAADE